jgi:hypothetical protein
LFTLLGITLAACNSTPTLIPTAAITLETPTLFSPTEKPTETKNPLAGAPEGATKPDGKGGWLKETAEGTFQWTVLKDENGKEIVSLWTDTRIIPGPEDLPGGKIPLIEYKDYSAYKGDSDPLDLSAQEGFNFPYFSHPANPEVDYLQSFSGWYNTVTIKGSDMSMTEAGHVRKETGTISIKFENGASTYTWETGKGVLFIAMSPDNLTPEKYPNLIICNSDDLLDRSVKFIWTAFTTPDHQLVILSTTAHPENLTPAQALRMVVGPLGVVSRGNISNTESAFLDTQNMVKFGVGKDSPHFVITPKQ